MIRILVMVLAAANLLYLGWSRWVREEQPRLVAPAPTPAREPAAASAAVQVAPSCTTIGPLRDEIRALEVEQLLRDMRLTPARRTVTEEVREGWWVYVTSTSAAAQTRALRAIQNAGIRDAFAMPDDPQFRVSVGLFMEEAGARSRAEAVRALRLEASINERMQQQTSIWFDLAGAGRAAVDLGRMGSEGLETQDLRVEECPPEDEVSIDAIIPPEEVSTTETAAPPQV